MQAAERARARPHRGGAAPDAPFNYPDRGNFPEGSYGWIWGHLQGVLRKALDANGHPQCVAAHTYSVMMQVRDIVRKYNRTDINLLRADDLALVHDLLEIIIGDPDINDDEAVAAKPLREKLGLVYLRTVLPPEMIEALLEYKGPDEDDPTRKDTPEARIVRASDKLEALNQAWLSQCKQYRHEQRSFEKVCWHHLKITRQDPDVYRETYAVLTAIGEMWLEWGCAPPLTRKSDGSTETPLEVLARVRQAVEDLELEEHDEDAPQLSLFDGKLHLVV